MITDSSMSQPHTVSDAIYALAFGLNTLFPGEVNTPFGELVQQIPPGHELHKLATMFWRCRCGRTGVIHGVCMTQVDGSMTPCCPDCDDLDTLELLTEVAA